MYKVIGGTALRRHHLVSWVKQYQDVENTGYKFVNEKNLAALSDPAEHRKAVERALATMEKLGGPVGRKLVIFLMAQRDVEIVCWPGVPGEFACPEEYPDFTAPTIMWDPYKCFHYFARRAVSLKEDPTGGKGQVVHVLERAVMPAWMVLAHEIGHFHHYVTERAWYTQCLANHDVAEIERRNLVDHEQPMLRAANLPVRLEYQDFEGGSNDGREKEGVKYSGTFTKKMTDGELLPSHLAAALKTLEAELQKTQEHAKLLSTKVSAASEVGSALFTCPKCGKSLALSTVKARLHEASCKG